MIDTRLYTSAAHDDVNPSQDELQKSDPFPADALRAISENQISELGNESEKIKPDSVCESERGYHPNPSDGLLEQADAKVKFLNEVWSWAPALRKVANS